jgi:hypothetical protein
MHAIFARLGREGVAGCAICLVGLVGFILVHDYPVGSLSEFGPGFVPWVATLGMMGLGGAMVARAIAVGGGAPLEMRVGRPLIVVPLGMAIFAFGLHWLGFAVASALAVFVTSLAGRDTSLAERVFASVFLAALATLIFGYGLSMTMPLWPVFLRS